MDMHPDGTVATKQYWLVAEMQARTSKMVIIINIIELGNIVE